MDCRNAETLLHPYLDGELDLVTSLAVEEHLRSCPACTRSHENFRALRAGLREASLSFAVPAALQTRIQTRTLAPLNPSVSPGTRVFTLSARRGWGMTAALLLAALLGWGFARVRSVPPGDTQLAQDVAADHVRSLMGTHLADVASSSQHTVKPWFAGKLDYSPPVKDLAAQGFPLIGGRLDYLDGRPVAALVYRHQKHLINLFVWPAKTGGEGMQSAPEAQTIQGYHLLHWDGGGMTYWSVSDLNAAELARFEGLIKTQS